MRKVLFTATVDGHILNFHIPYLKWFKEQGYEVHVASSGNSEISFVDIKYNVPFERSPFKISNINAYKQLRKIIDGNNYDIIHCHTPVGGVLTRLAARKVRLDGTEIIYTAHGFHFFKGASLINWLVYYPIERWLSRYTDVLITINQEDYERAKKFKAKRVEYVAGVGIDVDKFKPQTQERKNMLREKLGYDENNFILIYVGELSYRKHQDLLIKVISLLKKDIPSIKLLLVGQGDYYDKYVSLINKINVKEQIHLLGYRNDVPELMGLSDVVVSSSRQEGLPVNVMEAMATGLPLVVSNCRGNEDLVRHNESGFIVDVEDADGFAVALRKLYETGKLRDNFGQKNLQLISKYSLESIIQRMKEIYKN